MPVEEVDHWLDLDPEQVAHLAKVAQIIGQAQMRAFSPLKVGLMLAGLAIFMVMRFRSLG